MKTSTLKNLFIIFIVCLFLIFLPSIWRMFFPARFNPEEVNFQKFAAISVSEITILKDKQKLHLVQSKGSWFIGKKSVDKTKIKDFFKTLNGATAEKLVSRNAANFSEFAVDEKSLTRLALKLKEKLYEFRIGNAAYAPIGFYARAEKSNNVYLIKSENLVNLLNADKNNWIKK